MSPSHPLLALSLALAAVACGGSSDTNEDASGSSAAATDAVAHPARCTADEDTYLSCETEHEEYIAVCGGKTNGDDYVQFRFGNATTTDRVIPADDLRTDFRRQTSFHMDRRRESGGISFSTPNSSYRYEVYTNGAYLLSGFESGVVVIDSNDREVDHLRCSLRSQGSGLKLVSLSKFY